MKIVKIKGHGLKAIDSNGDEIKPKKMPMRVDLELNMPEGIDYELSKIEKFNIVLDQVKVDAKASSDALKSTEKTKADARVLLLKNKNASVKDKLDAIIEHLGLDN